jgi:hypothetical protein
MLVLAVAQIVRSLVGNLRPFSLAKSFLAKFAFFMLSAMRLYLATLLVRSSLRRIILNGYLAPAGTSDGSMKVYAV